MKAVRLMLIDAADTTPRCLRMEPLPEGKDTPIEHAASARGIERTLRWFEPDLVLPRKAVARKGSDRHTERP